MRYTKKSGTVTEEPQELAWGKRRQRELTPSLVGAVTEHSFLVCFCRAEKGECRGALEDRERRLSVHWSI